jgi:acetyl-CoA carboxylase biotin carboxyl carrier protein
MAGSGPNPGDMDTFDVKRIRRLVELMNEHELAEVDLRQGDQRIRLRKIGDPVVAGYLPAPMAHAAPPLQSASAAGAAPSAPPADAHLELIKSPMVGTFYSSPDPNAPPFVKVGDHVASTTTACVIEAMKVFNEIPAEVSGQVVAVLVENGAPVEFGQPLFKVDPRK